MCEHGQHIAMVLEQQRKFEEALEQYWPDLSLSFYNPNFRDFINGNAIKNQIMDGDLILRIMLLEEFLYKPSSFCIKFTFDLHLKELCENKILALWL